MIHLLISPAPRLLKIDVQGPELDVPRGAGDVSDYR